MKEQSFFLPLIKLRDGCTEEVVEPAWQRRSMETLRFWFGCASTADLLFLSLGEIIFSLLGKWQPENFKCKLSGITAVLSLQKEMTKWHPTQTEQISPCLSYGQRLFAPCLHCQVSGAHKVSEKAQTLQDLALQICSWDDWTLSLITSHLSLCFQIIFFLKKKEKHYTVADDGKGGGSR